MYLKIRNIENIYFNGKLPWIDRTSETKNNVHFYFRNEKQRAFLSGKPNHSEIIFGNNSNSFWSEKNPFHAHFRVILPLKNVLSSINPFGSGEIGVSCKLLCQKWDLYSKSKLFLYRFRDIGLGTVYKGYIYSLYRNELC